jgi:hypothetical protein
MECSDICYPQSFPNIFITFMSRRSVFSGNKRGEDEVYDNMSRHPNSGQVQNIRTANESFENVRAFKYLGKKLTNQNDILDKMKSKLNSGNACYYSVQNLLSSHLLTKKD